MTKRGRGTPEDARASRGRPVIVLDATRENLILSLFQFQAR